MRQVCQKEVQNEVYQNCGKTVFSVLRIGPDCVVKKGVSSLCSIELVSHRLQRFSISRADLLSSKSHVPPYSNVLQNASRRFFHFVRTPSPPSFGRRRTMLKLDQALQAGPHQVVLTPRIRVQRPNLEKSTESQANITRVGPQTIHFSTPSQPHPAKMLIRGRGGYMHTASGRFTLLSLRAKRENTIRALR